jgi:exosortase/archaeosortase family protein
VLNAVRIFLTGFFVYFVDPRLAEGIMHVTEGWAIFVVAFIILAGFAWVLSISERKASKDVPPADAEGAAA